MPPKFKFTKDEIIEAAVSLVREEGTDALTARSLADRLGSSSKPIFGLFSGMEEVKNAVFEYAYRIYQSYLVEDIKSGKYPPYKASGMGYIRFAKEEKELFKLLFMCDRDGDTVDEDRESIRDSLDMIQMNIGLNEDEAYLFHLEMWIFVHGIATMYATSYLDWDMDFVSRALTDAYRGLQARFAERRNEDGSH